MTQNTEKCTILNDCDMCEQWYCKADGYQKSFEMGKLADLCYSVGFKWREGGMWRAGKTTGGAASSVRGESAKHKTQRNTSHQRQSLFIIHNTSLFTLHSRSNHGFYSNQIIATEALYTVCKTKTNKRRFFLQVSNPFNQVQKEEGGIHPLGRKAETQCCHSLMYYSTFTVWASQGQAEVTGTKQFQQSLAKRFLSY